MFYCYVSSFCREHCHTPGRSCSVTASGSEERMEYIFFTLLSCVSPQEVLHSLTSRGYKKMPSLLLLYFTIYLSLENCHRSWNTMSNATVFTPTEICKRQRKLQNPLISEIIIITDIFHWIRGFYTSELFTVGRFQRCEFMPFFWKVKTKAEKKDARGFLNCRLLSKTINHRKEYVWMLNICQLMPLKQFVPT